MASRRLKTVVLHLMLISSSLIQPNIAQRLANVNPVGQNSFIPNGQFNAFPSNTGFVKNGQLNIFPPSQGFIPSGQFNTFPPSQGFIPSGQFNTFPSNKGFLQPQSGDLGYYYTHPVNSQYWTGPLHNSLPHIQPPLYQQYDGYQQYNPNQFGPWNNPLAKFSQWNTMQFPAFDASYWTGAQFNPNYHASFYPQPFPVRPHPVYPHPVFHPHAAHHPAFYQRAMHPGQYPYHPGFYGRADPYSQRGFFGGTGKGLTKGLLGALVVGVVAGAVARGK